MNASARFLSRGSGREEHVVSLMVRERRSGWNKVRARAARGFCFATFVYILGIQVNYLHY